VRFFLVPLLAAFYVSSIAALQPNAPPLTLDAALAYARQHSRRLSAVRQSVTARQAAIAAARAQSLPRGDLGASLRGTNQLTETALGFPLSSLADVPQMQPFARRHLNAGISATLPIYTGGRISSATGLARSERDLAQASVRDVERDLDFDVTSAYVRLVELDRDVEAAQESLKALTESRRIVAEALQVGKVARVDLLKIDTRLADVQATLIELTNNRLIQAGQLNALLGRPIETSVVAEAALPEQPIQVSPDQLSQAVAGNTKYLVAQAQLSVAERSAHASIGVRDGVWTGLAYPAHGLIWVGVIAHPGASPLLLARRQDRRRFLSEA
jgi:outer membrane protein TolC